jgi:hypothetical protein
MSKPAMILGLRPNIWLLYQQDTEAIVVCLQIMPKIDGHVCRGRRGSQRWQSGQAWIIMAVLNNMAMLNNMAVITVGPWWAEMAVAIRGASLIEFEKILATPSERLAGESAGISPPEMRAPVFSSTETTKGA